jgi:Arc/MetJ family transcription regulator
VQFGTSRNGSLIYVPGVGGGLNDSSLAWISRIIQRLRRMHKMCILVHMRTTLNIDDALLDRAAKLTGTSEKTALVRRGLEALIAHESARRLAALGGTEPQLKPIPRRRSPAA